MVLTLMDQATSVKELKRMKPLDRKLVIDEYNVSTEKLDFK